MPEPTFFASQEKWRAWLEKNHAKQDELLVAQDEAIGFGTAAVADVAVDTSAGLRRQTQRWRDVATRNEGAARTGDHERPGK